MGIRLKMEYHRRNSGKYRLKKWMSAKSVKVRLILSVNHQKQDKDMMIQKKREMYRQEIQKI